MQRLTRRPTGGRSLGRARPAGTPMRIVLDPADCEEPTWEVRRPDAHPPGRRRLDRRTRVVLAIAAITAVAANGGAAWAYWKVSAPARVGAPAAAVVELSLRGRSDLGQPLRPGGTGNLTVTVTNDSGYPIRITSVSPGAGHIVADDEHRDLGCVTSTGVSVTRKAFPVSWEVARNTIGAFTVPDGLAMAAGTRKGCAGATFTVPVRADGVRNDG